MSDHLELEEGEGPAPAGHGLIVVPYRPGRAGSRFLPPLLVLMLGVGFLGYRVSVRDWRGVFGFFDSPLARVADRSADAPRALARPAPDSTPVPPRTRTDQPAETPRVDKEVDTARAPRDTAARDRALGEIEREADETRKRIAALEAMKEEESRRLAETAPERRQEARRDAAPRFLPPPDEIERLLAAQVELLRRQMDEMMRRQMAWIDQARRTQPQQPRVFRGQPHGRSRDGLALGVRPGVRPGTAVPWPPSSPRLDVPPPPVPDPPPFPTPAFGRGTRVQRFRTPDGGRGEVRQFQGPAGAFGLELRWRSSGQALPDDTPPPPPRPALRFD